MTNKQALTNAMNFLDDYAATIKDEDILIEIEGTWNKLSAMAESLAKKTTSKKPTAKQQENECRKQQILDVLYSSSGLMKCGEIATAVGISGNQASALLSQLVKAEAVERSKGAKGVSLFSLRVAE